MVLGVESRGSRTSPFSSVFEGGRYRRHAMPPRRGAQLESVSCSSPSNCVAVGRYAPLGHEGGVALTELWNGSRWRVLPLAPGPIQGTLSAVSCPTRTACVAVGQDDLLHRGFAEDWNGSSWEVTPLPPMTAPPMVAGFHAISQAFTAVSCASSHFCMALGELVGLAETWDGTRWSRPMLGGAPIVSPLAGVSCSAGSSCVAVGEEEASGGTVGVALQWSSGVWRVIGRGGPSLAEPSCEGRDWCLIVGPWTLSVSWGPSGWARQSLR